MAETRKIAAILVADVVGYSRLAGADEEGTLARLRALRSDLIDPTVAVHRGRIVDRTGDGSLTEFRSVVDAVRCAVEFQSGMVECNAGLPPEKRIEFRVGIHLGDVVEEADGALMGDGVNIAARLEGICAPGGICLSEDAWRQVRDKLKEAFVDLGEKALKNIARPMRIYALNLGSAGTAHAPTVALLERREPPRLSLVVLRIGVRGLIEGALSFVADPIAAFAAAEAKLTKALSSVPDHALGHTWLGLVDILTKRAAQGIAECEHALALDRNLATAHAVIGQARFSSVAPKKRRLTSAKPCALVRAIRGLTSG
jgi:class 3 adenylate cyclase